MNIIPILCGVMFLCTSLLIRVIRIKTMFKTHITLFTMDILTSIYEREKERERERVRRQT